MSRYTKQQPLYDEKGMRIRPKDVKKDGSGFNFSEKPANAYAKVDGGGTEVWLTRDQEVLNMKAKSRGMDYSMGKNRTEDKKYEYYGSSRYYGE